MTNDEKKLVIEQVDHTPAENKLDAVIRVTKMQPVSRENTMGGYLNELLNIQREKAMLESKEAELIELIATIAVAQEYTDEEIAEIEKNLFVDQKIKSKLLAKIKANAEDVKENDKMKVVGTITKDTFIEKKEEKPKKTSNKKK